MGADRDTTMPRWRIKHMPLLAVPGEGDDVWALTYCGELVPNSDVYGRGFAQAVADDLNAKEGDEPLPPGDGGWGPVVSPLNNPFAGGEA